MKTNRLFIFLIIVTSILIGVLNIQAQDKIRWESGKCICESKFQWDAKPGGSIEVTVNSMDVTLSGGSENTIILEERIELNADDESQARKYYDKSHPKFEQSGNTFTLRSPDTPRQFQGGSLKLRIPENFNVQITTSGGDLETNHIKGNVTLTTSGGDIKIAFITGTSNLTTSGGDIIVEDVEGPVNATTSGGDIEVKRSGPNLVVHTSGGDIQLSMVKGIVDGATSGGDITVTDLDGEGKLKTSGGDIQIQTVRGGKVLSAATSGGDIIAKDITADISLATSSGDIDIVNVKGLVKAATSNGDIQGDNIESITIKLATSNGDVSASDIQGELQIATSFGNITAKLKASAESSSIDLASSKGDIVCQLPKNYRGTVEAKIDHWVEDESNDIHSDFPLSIRTEDSDVRVGTGDINGGGPAIRLKTTRDGEIRIEKY